MQPTLEKELLEKEIHGQVKGELLSQTTFLSPSPNNFHIDAYNKGQNVLVSSDQIILIITVWALLVYLFREASEGALLVGLLELCPFAQR